MIEFSASENQGFTPVPSGTYDVQIDSVELGMSKNSNQQLILSGHIADGPQIDRKVKIWYTIVPKSGWKLRNLLDAAEVDYELKELGEGEVEIKCDENDLVGCYVRYECEQEKYQGRDTNRWNKEMPSPLAQGGVKEEASDSAPTENKRRRSRERANA